MYTSGVPCLPVCTYIEWPNTGYRYCQKSSTCFSPTNVAVKSDLQHASLVLKDLLEINQTQREIVKRCWRSETKSTLLYPWGTITVEDTSWFWNLSGINHSYPTPVDTIWEAAWLGVVRLVCNVMITHWQKPYQTAVMSTCTPITRDSSYSCLYLFYVISFFNPVNSYFYFLGIHIFLMHSSCTPL